MAARIVIQNKVTKLKRVLDYHALKEAGKSEADVKFDPDTEFKYYEAYINKRSKILNSIRFQRKVKCESLKDALKIEKKLIQDCIERIAKEESKGNTWEAVISLWEHEATRDYAETKKCFNPLNGRPIAIKTVRGNIAMLKTYTKDWLKIPSSQLSRVHGKTVIRSAEEIFEAYGSVKRLRSVIYSVYNFGIDEGVIRDVKKTPVCGVAIEVKDEDTLPEILTQNEVSKLINEAKTQNHNWYPVWMVALATGMRSSELYSLRKDNVLLDEGIIRISESWDWENECPKSTKAGYWRNAPIAKSILPLVTKLMEETPGDFLFPRIHQWERGEQAMVLRSFCNKIGIPSVRFHTLRACFATHLLASGIDQAVVMRIGGWRTFKTFEVYIRLAGVKEAGATDGMMARFLDFSDKEIFDQASESLVENAS